jgi:hypothetical protein
LADDASALLWCSIGAEVSAKKNPAAKAAGFFE